MMLYRNTKVKVRSPDGDTDYFDIVVGIMQGATLAPYLFINCLDYVLRTSIDLMKENGFKLTKERSKRYPTQTITDADDIALLANVPAQAETRLQSLEWAAVSIEISGSVNLFIYLGCNFSSTETYVNVCIRRVWNTFDRLSSYGNLTSMIKWNEISSKLSVLLFGCTP